MASPVVETSAPPGRVGSSLNLQKLTLVYPFTSIVALIVFFAVKNSNFLTLDNAANIGRQSAVLLLVALAGTLIILIGSIDLSVGAIVTITGIMAAKYLDSLGVVPAILIAIAIGAVVGAVNGVLLTRLKIPSFLVTLGMLSVLTGIANTIANGAPVLFREQGLSSVANNTTLLGIPNVVLIAAVVTAILTFVVFRTKFGRYLYAIGGGEPVAALSGIPIRRFKVLAFVVAGALCGLSGALLTGQVGAGTPDVGSSYLLDSIAAVVMGGTALSGGIGGPHRTVLGVLVIAILSNGMDIIQVGDFTQDIVKGLVVILAVALTIDRQKYPFMK